MSEYPAPQQQRACLPAMLYPTSSGNLYAGAVLIAISLCKKDIDSFVPASL